MACLYDAFGAFWQDENYGSFAEFEVEARAVIKAEFPSLKRSRLKICSTQRCGDNSAR
jgi:type I restriction enzyme M protein